MEDLINSIPKARNFGKDNEGKDILSGICLKYRPEINKWACGYGAKANSFGVLADDPVEAVAFFVEKISKDKQKQ